MNSAGLTSSVKPRFIETLHIVGSFTSITGVTLLWVKDLIGSLEWEVVLLVAFIAPAQLGLASGLFWLLRLGYRKEFIQQSRILKFMYLGLGFPLVPALCIFAALIVNKIFISISWDWFFS